MEGNLANEVGLVVLDTIELFCGHFKVSALLCFFWRCQKRENDLNQNEA